MPTLRALECLVAVVDHGSFTAAARELHLSQPALSHPVRTLERELGAQLLERLPRGVRATTAGEVVVEDARTAIRATVRLVERGREAAVGRVGRLRVGCAETLTSAVMGPVLRDWRASRPEVTIELTEASSADVLADHVLADELDVAICPRPSRHEVTASVVGHEELVVVTAGSTSGPAPWAEVGAMSVVHYDLTNGLASWLDRTAAEHGVVLEAVTRVRSAHTAARLAASGLGAAIVPTSALPGGSDVSVRRLDPSLTREVVALTRGGPAGLERRFVEHVAQVAGDTVGP